MGENIDKNSSLQVTFDQMAHGKFAAVEDSEWLPVAPVQSETVREACSFLGLANDPDTFVAYISTGNFCHRKKRVKPAPEDHQARFCLGASHHNCPILTAAENKLARSTPAARPKRQWLFLATFGRLLGK